MKKDKSLIEHELMKTNSLTLEVHNTLQKAKEKLRRKIHYDITHKEQTAWVKWEDIEKVLGK